MVSVIGGLVPVGAGKNAEMAEPSGTKLVAIAGLVVIIPKLKLQ